MTNDLRYTDATMSPVWGDWYSLYLAAERHGWLLAWTFPPGERPSYRAWRPGEAARTFPNRAAVCDWLDTLAMQQERRAA